MPVPDAAGIGESFLFGCAGRPGYYEATWGAPNSEAMQSARAVIEAKAYFDGGEHPVHVRVSGDGTTNSTSTSPAKIKTRFI